MSIALTNVQPAQNLGALIEAQGMSLVDSVDRATEVFKKNQEAQKETIDKLTKAVADLEAALIKERSEKEQQRLTYDAAIKALKDKDAQKTILILSELNKIAALGSRISSVQKNLPFKFHHEFIAAELRASPSHGYGNMYPPLLGYGGNYQGFLQWSLNQIDPEFKAAINTDPYLTIDQLTKESKKAAESIQSYVNSLKKQLNPKTP